MTDDSANLVFSTDRNQPKICPVCSRQPCACSKGVEVVPAETVVRIQLDKKGRKGKAVTVLFDLPHNPDYFADLAKKLKRHCGSGGAFKDGSVEIQGDHREQVEAYLAKLGFQVRQVGK